mmetsp:Transcript_9699/g.29140  ORF Transcript_9699/g.29140 Transcript_9699/m.29140 type:complete len:313 (+) Transcript_9699:2679-3617(+)
MAPAVVGDGVGVDHRGTATRHHRPDPSLLIQDGELQRGTGLAIHVPDESLLGVGSAPKGGRPVDLAPFLRAQEVARLVELRGHVQGHHGAILQHDQRVDLQVSKVELLVEPEERHDEARQVLLLVGRDLAEELLRHSTCIQGLACGYLQPLCLGVDVADVDAPLVVEQDLVVVAGGDDADVEFLGLLVGHKGLHQEVRELPGDILHLLVLAHPLHHPVLCLIEGLVHCDEPGLATPLDQLVGLGHELLLLQPGVRLHNGIPSLAAGLVQHLGPDQRPRARVGVLPSGVLRQPFLQQGLPCVLADRLHRHGCS